MSWKDKVSFIRPWAFVFAGLAAIFWTSWSFLQGSVPEPSSVNITDTLIWQYPVALSRWFDIFIGPLWATIVGLIYTSHKIWGLKKIMVLQKKLDGGVGFKIEERRGKPSALVFDIGLVSGLAACASVFYLGSNLDVTMVAALIAGSLSGLIILTNERPLIEAFFSILISVFIVSFFAALVHGIVAGILISLVMPVVVITALIAIIFMSVLWLAISISKNTRK